MLAITTFPQSAWDFYARFCVERMIAFWPGPVRVYFEGWPPPAVEGAELRPLDSIPERTEFLSRDIPPAKNWLRDAKRFCHKVFAQLNTMEDNKPFWWIDADVAISRAIPESMVEVEDVLMFLGRDSYTETGLIGFNPKHSDFAEFEDNYRKMYTHGRIFTLGGWTDCHAFDAAREGKGYDMTPGGRGFDNVMEDSVFGPYMTHFKGPRKAQVYQLGGAHEISANL